MKLPYTGAWQGTKNAFFRYRRLSNKTQICFPLSELQVNNAHWILQTIAIVTGYPLELYGKILLLKTSHV